MSDTPEKLSYNLKEAAASIGVSTDFIQRQIRMNKLGAKKIGSRIVITASELRDWLDTQPDA